MKIHFGYLLGIAALSLASCAAFFSIVGLSQLFAGASLAVIIMATALEFSKVVIASFLHQYWLDINKIMKVYLVVGVTILVLITSAGIYGFLSSAFQQTTSKHGIMTLEVKTIDLKIDQFNKLITTNTSNLKIKNDRITQLTSARSSQENRLNTDQIGVSKRTRSDINSANLEIKELNAEVSKIVENNNKLSDSINSYNNKKLKTSVKNESSSELGPLIYIAELTGLPMNKIVNYFILLLIFVFDPLAVSLVIATTAVFKIETNKNLIQPYVEPVKEEIIEEIIEDVEPEPIKEEIIEDVIPITEVKPLEDKKIPENMNNRGFTIQIPDNGIKNAE